MDIALIFVRQYFKYFTCINLFNPQNNSMRQVLLSSSFYWWQSHSQRSNLPMVIQLRSDRTSMAPISSVILKNVLSTTMPCCFPVRMIVILAWCLWGCFFTCSFLLLALSKICSGTQFHSEFYFKIMGMWKVLRWQARPVISDTLISLPLYCLKSWCRRSSSSYCDCSHLSDKLLASSYF